MTRIPTAMVALLVGLAFVLPTTIADGEPPREGETLCGGPLDVLFVFDTTGSMGGVLSSAKSGAASVMANVQATIPGAAFGVADYRDTPGYHAYPGYAASYGGANDWAWKLLQPLDPDATQANAAIATLTAGGGADGPEALTRAVYESYADTNVAWRAGSDRIVVLFTDAPAHDTNFNGWNTGGDPGRDGVALTADDLDFETSVAFAGGNGLRFAAIGAGFNGGAAYLQYLAAETDGAYAPMSGNFVQQVTDLILDLAGYHIEAHADALIVDASTLTSAYLDVAHVEAGPHADSHDETLLTLTFPPSLNGFAKTAEGHAHTVHGAAYAEARGINTIERVSLLGGLVQASTLRADAFAALTPTGAYGDTSGSHVARVTIAGIPVQADPNTHVPLPNGLGYVVINERIVHQPTSDSVSVEVNMIRIVLDGPGIDADIKISHAFATVSCDGELDHHDGPSPPQDPEPPTLADPECPAQGTSACKTYDLVCSRVCPSQLIEYPDLG